MLKSSWVVVCVMSTVACSDAMVATDPMAVTASGGASMAPKGGAGASAVAGAPAASSGGAGIAAQRPASAGTRAAAQGGAGSAAPAGQGGAGSAAGAGSPAKGGAGSAAGAGGPSQGGAGAVAAGSCESLPSVSDYAQPGPFADAKMFEATGPNGNYTLFRPDSSLGKDGLRHPIATWGNGIATTPDQYRSTLTLIASHGFVIIGCNDTQAERPCLSDGLDWLIEQNDAEGPLRGKLDVEREVAIGYSWGGGAAIDTSDRPNIRATVSLHGMPPRGTTAFESMHSPLLLFTSTGDTFVTPEGYVTPNYEKSTVQTFYATLDDLSAGHLYVADTDAVSCAASAALGTCGNAEAERAPTIAWLRYWVCNDQAAQTFFFGDDCTLCKAPWTMPQRKHWP